MIIEKLTDEARRTLEDGGLLRGDDALRIIDALTAALEAAGRKAESWERGHDYAWAEKTAAESRAEALQARVSALEAERAGLIKHHELFVDGIRRNYSERLDAAEAKRVDAESKLSAALTCGCRKGLPYAQWCRKCCRDDAAESELATAKARVAELEKQLADLKS